MKNFCSLESKVKNFKLIQNVMFLKMSGVGYTFPPTHIKDKGVCGALESDISDFKVSHSPVIDINKGYLLQLSCR